MSTHIQELTSRPSTDEAEARLLLVGNPNVGKSAIFGHLTGSYVTVSNYPGTTVEITSGTANLAGRRWDVIDTPGINTLIPQSEDEQVARDMLLEGRYEAVVQVGDMKNLRRILLITLQLAEMDIPFVLALNMQDEARSAGIDVDVEALSGILGIPVVATIATQKKGLSALVDRLDRVSTSDWGCSYPASVERAISEVVPLLPAGLPMNRRSVALMLLAGDDTLRSWIWEQVDEDALDRIDEVEARLGREYPNGAGFAINQARLRTVDRVMKRVYRQQERKEGPAWLTRLGHLAAHPVWGIPILLAVLYAAYQLVGVFGAGTLVDLLEGGFFEGWLNPLATRLFETVIPIPIVREFFVGEYGIITMALTYAVAIVLPIVGTFFVFFGALEDSGYMPRLAVMVNRIFRRMGLNGKAVLPMVLGLGCDTMATMTTRIMETRKERVIVTLLLALGVPCSAQLGVILGMLGGLSFLAAMIWVGTVLGTLFLVGWLSSKLLPGEGSDFVLELPPIRMPRFGNIAVKTMARIEWYLKEAVPLFILGTIILFVLDRLGALVLIQEGASPLVQGALGLPAKATDAFLVGFLRRDYGAAGLFDLSQQGQLDPIQTLVSLIVITLFMPCIANFLMIIKEQGIRTALAMAAFILPFAMGVGILMNLLLRAMGPGVLG
ncbi:MAG: ferrous iron transport protein B [bacterium]